MSRRWEQPLTPTELGSSGPERIGRYQVQTTIGVGGFARVLRAYDESLDDSVAIKVLAENWATDDEIRSRFVDEAKLLRRVRSEHLITVHDIGDLPDGRPYFVMEFADAGTLAGRLKTRRTHGLDPASARSIINALAEGLGALHSAGVVHRDVNPKNLLLRHARDHSQEPRAEKATRLRPGLVSADEHILLGDLGLAKDLVRSGSNAVSLVGGTANYIPPEQADPTGIVGPEADVFAATGVLWECLTATPPPNPTTLAGAAAGLDERWRSFFATGFALEAHDRFSSMDKWRAAALDAVTDDGPMSFGTAARHVAGTDDSPYLGLAAFQPEDADRFFGRSTVVAELLDRLRQQRMLVVAGPSGSGKSSIVRAGLIPAIAAGAISGSERWPIALLTPGSNPLGELSYQLSKLTSAATQQTTHSVTAEDLAMDPNRGRFLADMITDAAGGALIVIDQFEELFTQGPGRDGQEDVLKALAALIDHADSSIRVVLAVRADFYGTCASFPWLADKITANQVLVGPMTRPELREAIEEPARRAGIVIESGVVDAVLDEGGSEPGSLPLVSHALAETWRRRRGSMMTLDGYREAGGVSGAIAKTANALYDERFDAAERSAVRKLMLRLVNPGEGTPDTKRSIPAGDLQSSQGDTVWRVAEEMTAARLLTASEDSIEIAHEALIRTWPRLRQWIEENRDDLRMRQHIARAASEWVEQDRDSDLLYRGTPLASALEWADTRPDVLEQADAEFLEASREARDLAAADEARGAARSRRLRTIAISVLSLLTVVAVVAGIAAANASRIANDRFSQSLAAQAANLATDNPRVALALAVEAIARGATDSFEARSALVDASRILAESPLASAASSFAVGDAKSMAVSPDGALVAVGYRDGTIRLWEPMSGRPLPEPFSGHANAINDVEFTNDGTQLLSASDDGTVRLWDATNPSAAGGGATVGQHDGIVWRIAIAPDGASFTSAGEDGIVQQWNLSGQRLGPPLADSTKDFLSVAYSPDGQTIYAGNGRGELHGWNTATSATVFPMQQPHESDIWHIVVGPSGATLATSSSDGTVQVLTETGEIIAEAYAGDSANGAGITFDPNGNLMIGTSEGQVGIWDPVTERLERTPPGHADEVLIVSMTPDGGELITLSNDQTVRAWTPAATASWTTLEGQTAGTHSVATRSDGTIATGDGTGAVRIFAPTATGGTLVVGLEHGGEVTALAFDRGGDSLVSGGADGAWWLIDVGGASPQLGPIHAHDSPIAAIEQTDGLIITGGDDGFVRVWNDDGSLRRELAGAHMGGVTALSAQGSRLATADRSGEVRIYDVGSGELRYGPFAADDTTIWALDLSSDGALLATASADHVVTVWNVETLDAVGMLTPHDDAVTGVAFVDQSTIASLDSRGGVRLWDVALERQLGKALAGHNGAAWDMDAAGANGLFVTGSLDGTVQAWNVLDVAAACEKSQGSFDAEQQRRYLDDSAAVGCVGAMP